jgi:membrane protease YdiL (CAAX protease family)
MAFIRLPLIFAGNAAIILVLRLAGYPVGFDIMAVFATLSVTLVNIVCIGLLRWRARVEGFQLGNMVGFQRHRILRDLAEGVLWSIVLFALMLGGAFATAFAFQSIAGLTFEQIYVGDTDFSFNMVPQWLTIAYAIIAAVVFPILNAPVEELQYRGYSQSRLIAASGRGWLGIFITAVGFGLQHMVFGFTLAAALMYSVGFFFWGLGAGIIANRQQRLFPLIIAHFISNLSFGIFPLVFMLSQA